MSLGSQQLLQSPLLVFKVYIKYIKIVNINNINWYHHQMDTW